MLPAGAQPPSQTPSAAAARLFAFACTRCFRSVYYALVWKVTRINAVVDHSFEDMRVLTAPIHQIRYMTVDGSIPTDRQCR